MNSLAIYSPRTPARTRPPRIVQYRVPNPGMVVAPILGTMVRTLGWCASLATQAHRSPSAPVKTTRWVQSRQIEQNEPELPFNPPSSLTEPQTLKVRRSSLLDIFD